MFSLLFQKTWFLTLSLPRSLLTVCHTILKMLVWRIWYWINNNPLIYIFLYSHYLSTWCGIDIVGRKSVLVTNESIKENVGSVWQCHNVWSGTLTGILATASCLRWRSCLSKLSSSFISLSWSYQNTYQ